MVLCSEVREPGLSPVVPFLSLPSCLLASQWEEGAQEVMWDPCVSSGVKELRKPCLVVGDVETASLMLLNSYGNPALVSTFSSCSLCHKIRRGHNDWAATG